MTTITSTSDAGETASDLRALYRASEARAARLRVLVEASRGLAQHSAGALDATIQKIAKDAAHLAGFARGTVHHTKDFNATDDTSLCIPLEAPGSSGQLVGTLELIKPISTPSIDDREAIDILAQLVGGAIAAQAREAQLATLLSELLKAQESERTKVAHELHDGVAQTAAALARRIDLASDGDPADLALAAEQARRLVRELRQVITGMRPPALDDLGLQAALRQIVDESANADRIALDIALDVRPPDVIETAIFRIVQEGLNNARAYAGNDAKIDVSVATKYDRYRVEIRDNGPGFDPATPQTTTSGKGLGLAYMRQRIERFGGRLTITSAPGHGCQILAELPLT